MIVNVLKAGKAGPGKMPGPVLCLRRGGKESHIALSITAWVRAPSGFLVITGSEPPDSSVSTVRS